MAKRYKPPERPVSKMQLGEWRDGARYSFRQIDGELPRPDSGQMIVYARHHSQLRREARLLESRY